MPELPQGCFVFALRRIGKELIAQAYRLSCPLKFPLHYWERGLPGGISETATTHEFRDQGSQTKLELGLRRPSTRQPVTRSPPEHGLGFRGWIEQARIQMKKDHPTLTVSGVDSFRFVVGNPFPGRQATWRNHHQSLAFLNGSTGLIK